LTAAQVQHIRRLRGALASSVVAARFGISQVHVFRIWARTSWKHVK
jgi:hypothetical protein